MRRSIACVIMMLVPFLAAQAQSRAELGQKLLVFLTTDLALTPDQQTSVRGFMKDADAQMAKYELQHFGNPAMLTKLRKQNVMDFGKRVQSILTPAQMQQYPVTRQKLYDALQKRYEAQMDKVQGSEGQAREKQEATARDPK